MSFDFIGLVETFMDDYREGRRFQPFDSGVCTPMHFYILPLDQNKG